MFFRELCLRSWGVFALQGFYSLLSGLFEPLTDCTLTHSKCLCNAFLFPTFFMQFPGLHPTLFTPIFLRCRFLVHSPFYRIDQVRSLDPDFEVPAHLPQAPSRQRLQAFPPRLVGGGHITYPAKKSISSFPLL